MRRQRVIELPEKFDVAIRRKLAELGYDPDRSKPLAEAVLRLSDHYVQNPTAITPWRESWTQAASVAYYFPLNYARCLAVANEARRLGFFAGLNQQVDFGSGTGSALAAFQELWPEGAERSTLAFDRDPVALELGSSLLGHSTGHQTRTIQSLSAATRGNFEPATLLTLSYVLTEFSETDVDHLTKFEALAIVEPSTREDGRALSRLRERLIDAGFYIWAPCTHQEHCPLLHGSERDWCHDRIHWRGPRWFENLEAELPMKNRTLTFSYLLARKSLPAPQSLKGLGRLTGDMLVEKGKTRQSICLNSQRRFLAWFPQRFKKREDFELQRGNLVRLKAELATKSDELRFADPADIEEIDPTTPSRAED